MRSLLSVDETDFILKNKRLFSFSVSAILRLVIGFIKAGSLVILSVDVYDVCRVNGLTF
jgi:tetrahydromethanopterin S-methyltransferase subunit F